MAIRSNMTYREAIAIHKAQCEQDPVYFMRNFCKIQHPKKGRIKFDLYDVQAQALKELSQYQYCIVNKTRQIGFSTLIAAYALWMMLFRQDTNILVIAIKLGTAKNLVTKVRVMYKELPGWLREEFEEDNKLSLRLKNGSQIRAEAATPDSGRSEALSLLVIDECAFVPYIEDIWTAANSTLSSGGDCILLSTPNGVANFFHKMWTKATNGTTRKHWLVPDPDIQGGRQFTTYQGIGENEFHPIFLHWSAHPDRDDVWRERETAKLGIDKAKQECDGDFLASGNTVVHPTIIQAYMDKYKMDPIEVRYGGKLQIFKYPEDDHRYLLCADVARGDGADSSAFHILDIDTLEQVADYDGQVDTNHYADVIYRVCREYNDALAVIENANIGWAVVQKLIDKEYPNLFYSSADLKYVDLSKNVFVNKFLQDEKKLIPGFSMTMKTRPLVVDKIDEYMREQSVIINSERTLNQFYTWIWTKTGRADHLPHYHDDLITSLGQGLWVRDIFIRLKDLQTAYYKGRMTQMINAAQQVKEQKGVYNSKHQANDQMAKRSWEIDSGIADKSFDLRELL